MAIVISDTNDKRKVGKVDYDVINYAPTIGTRAGSRTVVQDTTPLRSSADKFMRNMQKAGQLYSQGVDVMQNSQKQTVAEMSEEEFNTLLTAGGTKEMNNLFGQSKAFHESVVKRAYATQVPTGLTQLSTELHADITQYEDIDDFQTKTEDKVNEYFTNLEKSFGGNVFSQKANNTLKAVTKSKFLLNQTKKYNEEILAFNKDEANRTAYSAFSDVNLDTFQTDNIDTIMTDLDKGLAPTITNKAERKKIITGGYMSAITSAWEANDWNRVEVLIEKIEGNINFSSGTSGNIKGDEYKVNGVPFFSDPKQQSLITQYIGNLEEAKYRHNEFMVKSEGVTILSDMNLEMNKIFELEGEEALAGWIQDTKESIAKTNSVTLNGKNYNHNQVLSLGLDYLTSQDSKYFEGTKNLQYQRNTEQPSKLYKDSLFKDENTFKALLSTTDLDSNHYFKVIAKGLETEESDEVAPWLADMTSEMDAWYNETYQSYIRDNDINAGNYTVELGEEFHTKFREQIKDKALELLTKYTPQDAVEDASFEQDAIDAGIEVNVYEKLKRQYSEDPTTFKKVITELKRNKADLENGTGSYDLEFNNDGTATPKIRGFFYETRAESFIDAFVDGQFEGNSASLIKEQEKLKRKSDGAGALDNQFRDYNKATPIERIKLSQEINKTLNIVGLPVSDIVAKNSRYNYIAATDSSGYKNHEGFNTFGIRLIPNDKISSNPLTGITHYNSPFARVASTYQATITALEEYQNNGKINQQLQKAADKLNMRVEDLIEQQIDFFTTGGYMTAPTQQTEE